MTNFKKVTDQYHMMLNLTDACNLRCRYCFVNQHPHYMSYQVAKDAVDFFIKIPRERDVQPSINYFGGEPTLMWDPIIVPLTKYLREERDYTGSIGMTSNCILMDKEKLDFMRKYGITLLTSFDGDKETQDYNRPLPENKSSFDVLAPKYKLILEYYPESTFRSTLVPHTCHNLFHNIMFARSLGFKHYYAIPDSWSTWTEESKKDLENNLNQYFIYMVETLKNEGKYFPDDFIHFTPLEDMIYRLPTVEQRAEKKELHMFGNYSCGLALGGFSVNYEGAIFGCQELPSLGYENNLHYIGDIYNGIDVKKHQELLTNFRGERITCNDDDYCEKCPLKYICSDLCCPATSYIITGKGSIKQKISCEWNNMLFKVANALNELLGKEKDSIYYKMFLQKN